MITKAISRTGLVLTDPRGLNIPLRRRGTSIVVIILNPPTLRLLQIGDLGLLDLRVLSILLVQKRDPLLWGILLFRGLERALVGVTRHRIDS